MIDALQSAGRIVLGAVLVCLSMTYCYAADQGAPIKIASLIEPGRIVPPGDLLRTTRIFPNWNLNCEVLLSEKKHLCAVERRSVDALGHLTVAWSFAVSSERAPIMVFKTPADIDFGYGLQMKLGRFTTVFLPKASECGSAECTMVLRLDTQISTLLSWQQTVGFTLKREGRLLQTEVPMQGLADALMAGQRDPTGLTTMMQPKDMPNLPSVSLQRKSGTSKRPANTMGG